MITGLAKIAGKNKISQITSIREQRLSYMILVFPALFIYLSVVAFPTIFSIVLSLTSYNGGRIFNNPRMNFAGLESYISVFTHPTFYTALKNNMFIVFVSVFGQIPLGFILAYVLSRKLVKGVDFFQTVVYLPCVITPVIIGTLFASFFIGDNSVLFEIRKFFNPEIVYELSRYPIISVLAVMLWMYTGTYVIIFLANIQRIDDSIIEAARIDGAGEGQILRRIMLPALSGVFVTCSILAISGSLKSFDLIFIMTRGGPANLTTVLSLFMYNQAFMGAPNYPLANAISTIMVLISFGLIGITMMLNKKFGGKE